MARETVSFNRQGIDKLPDNKPVVYRILTESGKNNHTGVAQRGRVQDRVAEHSRSSKGRPNPRAQLTTSYSADSAGQSHGRDESACLILAKQSQRRLSRVLARMRDPSRSLDTGA